MGRSKSTETICDEPTREDKILDLIFSYSSNIVDNIEILEHFSSSDHKSIKFQIVVSFQKQHKTPYLYRQLTSKGFLKMNKMLATINFEYILSSYYTVDGKYNKFIEIIYWILNNFHPLTSVKQIVKDKYNAKIKTLYSRKLRLHR